jgi:type I restriction enzyme S subunit
MDITKVQQSIGTVPVVSSGGVSSYHDKAAVKGPGVVLGRKGVVGSVYFIPTDYWPHDTTLWVKDFHGNDPRFVYYFFKSLAPLIAGMDVGSSNPTLNRNHVHPIEVRWPPVDRQRVISEILGALDDKIELNRWMSETLEAMARALFKSWFVDFDPVQAKVEGRDTGLPEEIADLFPDSFEDSELGEIPTGWAVEGFSRTVEILGGGTPQTSVAGYWGGDIPWFSIVDAPRGTEVFVIRTAKKITEEGLRNSATHLVPVGTTIISARGTVGRIALTGVPMALNQSCYGLRGKDASKTGAYTYFATRTLVSALQRQAHGSVFDTITRDTLAGVPFVVPQKGLKNAFEAAIEPIMARLRSCVAEIDKLTASRDALLPKLVSGELRAAIEVPRT